MMISNYDENNLIDCIQFVKSFHVFRDGKMEHLTAESEDFNYIKNNLKQIFLNSRLMPAFGVSLHEETQNELKNGVWLQINFNTEQTKNGLQFSSLLFKLEKTQGFNLIRLYNDKYDGRCLYLDLDEETDLMTVINQKNS